ncbi:class I SAM-dependent methyltransferase [Streptomyces sp. 6N223]|uniref:class I SAM-dependent methyltransferase n=1 Tax=Streptomyces sp. 6N223 TaxID=3457412 RepID=UPI003FD4F698
MRDASELRETFDEVAEVYDRARPRYPRELVARLLAGCGRRVLEVGPGTGQLTAELAADGRAVTAVELGPALAEVARRRLAGHPGARAHVEVANFETWPLPPEPFDAVVFATSFHWIDPAVRLAKAARALRPGGLLAVVTTHHVGSGGSSSAFFARVQGCYERWMPGTPPGLRLRHESEVATDTGELAADDRFGEVRVYRSARDVTYSAEEYLEVLSTYSGHRALDPGARARLFGCVRALIDGEHGGRVTKRYLHELITMERR